MRQAPGDLGKIQWDAASGRSAIDNLAPHVALVLARDLFASILKRIEALNDRYYPAQGGRVERIAGDEGLVIDFEATKLGQVDADGCPVATGFAIDQDNNTVQDARALGVQKGVGLHKDADAAPDRAEVVSFFERRLDRFFGR